MVPCGGKATECAEFVITSELSNNLPNQESKPLGSVTGRDGNGNNGQPQIRSLVSINENKETMGDIMYTTSLHWMKAIGRDEMLADGNGNTPYNTVQY